MGAISDKMKALTERKSRIIEAALACFLEHGYHQTGIREIAKKAGISLGNLYNHFPSKEAVLAEIAVLEREELKPFLRLLENHDEPEATLMRFVDNYVVYADDPDNLVLSVEIISEAVHKPEIASLFMANLAELVSALSGLLGKGSEKGCFRKFDDPELTARIILDIIEGHALRKNLGSDSRSTDIDGLKDFVRCAICP